VPLSKPAVTNASTIIVVTADRNTQIARLKKTAFPRRSTASHQQPNAFGKEDPTS
jgi:hypothetical protein